ncbi:MAG TPA: MFS transporter [Sphingobium sp.]
MVTGVKEIHQGAGARAWWLLGLLVAIHSCNWMDRYLATILLQPIKEDLKLSDTQLGTITGFGFSVVYSLTALPLARMVDVGPRKLLLSLFVGTWSTATMLASMVTGFLSLAATRVAIAASESGCSPTAYSLISDSFPAQFRGRAISLYALGVPFGAWAGLGLGGYVNALYGWRATFLILGAPGLLLALFTLLWMREPARGRFDTKESAAQTFTVIEALHVMKASPAFILSCASIGLLAITTSSFQGWAPTFMMRSQGLSSSAVGIISGTMSGIGGILAALIAGLLVDSLGRRDPRWYLWLPMAGAAILLPAEFVFLRSEGALSYVCYFITVFAGGAYVAPLFTLCQILLPPRMRAIGSAAMLLVINLVGMGGGIFAAGALSDIFLARGFGNPLGTALQCLQFGAVLSIGTLAWAATYVKHEGRPGNEVPTS